jgi:hypothetical protein
LLEPELHLPWGKFNAFRISPPPVNCLCCYSHFQHRIDCLTYGM